MGEAAGLQIPGEELKDSEQADQALERRRAIIAEWERIEDQKEQRIQISLEYQAMSADAKKTFVYEKLQALKESEDRVNMEVFSLLILLYSLDKTPFYSQHFERYLDDLWPDGNLGLNKLQAASLFLNIHFLTTKHGSPEASYQLHMILDFLIEAMEAVDRSIGEIIDQFFRIAQENEWQLNYFRKEGWPPPCHVRDDLIVFADFYSDFGSSYWLITKKFEDGNKPTVRYPSAPGGQLDGMDFLKNGDGLSTAAAAYALNPKNALNNWENRRRFDFWLGEQEMDGLFPIAAGFYGLYQKGVLSKIYQDCSDGKSRGDEIRNIIQSHHSKEHDELYNTLNAREKNGKRAEGLDIYAQKDWELAKCIDWEAFVKNNSDTLIDLEKIDVNVIHPFVLAKLIEHNVRVLRGGRENSGTLTEVKPDELLNRLYPTGASAQDVYFWRTLSGLSVRKKLEDELGIYIEIYPLWTQRLILEWVNTLTLEDVPWVKDFLSQGNTEHRLIALVTLWSHLPSIRAMFRLQNVYDLNPLFAAYAQGASSAEQTAAQVHQLYNKAFPKGNRAYSEFFHSILARSKTEMQSVLEDLMELRDDTLFTEVFTLWDKIKERITRWRKRIEGSLDSIWVANIDGARARCAVAIKKLHHANQNIAYTAQLVASLSAEERRALNIEQLSTITLHELFAQQLSSPEYRSIRQAMMRAIEINFPAGDVGVFENDFLNHPKAQIYFCTVAGELVVFFGALPITNDFFYLDWLSNNPEGVIKGLAEPTLYRFIHQVETFKNAYLVAKPYVHSYQTLFNLGFVTFGTTKEGEHKHHYLRCRKMEEEAGVYVGQRLSADQTTDIQKCCEEFNQLYEAQIGEAKVYVCKVQFVDCSHEDDLSAKDAQGWIFETVDSLCSKGEWVMSAYIPATNNTPECQTYYCVFEPSQLNQQTAKALNEDIATLRPKKP